MGLCLTLVFNRCGRGEAQVLTFHRTWRRGQTGRSACPRSKLCSRQAPPSHWFPRNGGQGASVRRPRDSWNRVVEQIATRLLRFATVRPAKNPVFDLRTVASRSLSETPGKDQKVAEPDGSVAIQVEPRVIPRVAPAEAESCRELHEVGETHSPVAVEVSSKG